mgnify:CR=1 FL=1
MPLPLSVLTLGADRFKAAPEIKGVTDDAKLRETASEFEAIFIQQMLKTMRDSGAEIVDIRKEPENEYAEHCRVADVSTRPLRDCISYYNGHGDAEPGSLAYYGGGRWHKYRIAAQTSLDPYLFDPAPEN